MNGVSGIVQNDSGTTNAVALYGDSRCLATSGKNSCWGENLVVGDSVGTSGQGSGYRSALYGSEVDIVPDNSADQSVGYLSVINSQTLTGHIGGSAFEATANDPSKSVWDDAFTTADGACKYYGSAGTSCASGACPSQPLQFWSNTGSQKYAGYIESENEGTIVALSNYGTDNFMVSNGASNGADGLFFKAESQSGNLNWEISEANFNSGSLDFAPSTTTGGTTFSSPVFSLFAYGAIIHGGVYGGVNANTSTSYTLLDTDHVVTFDNSSAVAVSLPACSSTSFSGWDGTLSNLGGGTVTVTANGTDTIVGAGASSPSYTIAQNHTSRVSCDGAGHWLLTLY